MLDWTLCSLLCQSLDLSFLECTAELLRKGRDIVNHIVMILPWALGGFILYYVLYQNRLVPRWLSVWGDYRVQSSSSCYADLNVEYHNGIQPDIFYFKCSISF